MARGEVEVVGRRRNGEASPGVSSRGRDRSEDGSDGEKWRSNLHSESPPRRKRVTRSPSEEYSDYSEEKQVDRINPRREERRERSLDRATDRRRHDRVKERSRGSLADVEELGTNNDRHRNDRKRERYSSPSDEDAGEDVIVEEGMRVGRSTKPEKNRRHDASEDEPEEDQIVGGTTTKKRKSRKRERSGKRHGMSDEDESEEDEVVVGTPTKKSRSRKHNERKSSRKRHRRARSDDSDEDSSESDEPSNSSSDTSETEDESRKEKERKRRKKERRKDKEREQAKEVRRKERRRLKELKEKKLKSEKKKKKREMRSKQPITTSWGKHGIVKDIDMWNKRPEFSSWLGEVKKVNMETLSNWEEKQMFKEYMEDYNTATFPSKKYYNLDLYYRRKMMKARMKGMAKFAKAERVDFNDEEQRRQELRKEREQKKEEDVEALMRTMQSGMAQAMREQAQLREEMQYQFRLGNVEAAQAIQRRLDPDADKLAKM